MNALIVTIVALTSIAIAADSDAEVKQLGTNAFELTYTLTLPGTPEEIFDAISGDISAWWDHSFSEEPKRLYIEPKIGGGFIEEFDDEGNGVRHATVTAVERGKLLRFVGPLGLAGNAILMTHTYEFTVAEGDSTRLDVTVRASGQMEGSWPDVVDGVWQHFLFERFEPYVKTGKHRDKAGAPGLGGSR